MGTKGEKTKDFISQEAYKLFAKKGYKNVTMKDICEKTGLSRGGLYRHYDSTETIFLEIVNKFLNTQQNEFQNKIDAKIPAINILNEVLKRYEKEMLDCNNSLSIAICEFFSNPVIAQSENSVLKRYLISKQMWIQLINYGISTNEFQNVSPEAVYDLIVFSYQGVRMYSQLMPIDPKTPKRIVEQIKHILIFQPVEVNYEK